MADNIRFDFGKNWKEYSLNSLDDDRFKKALDSLNILIGKNNIKNKSFLDIGSGSGIFSLAAKKLNAKKVIGFDISQNSVEIAYFNKNKFAKNEDISFFKQSIVDKNYKKFGKFDIVYSWGVLHHTGNMFQAIDNSITLVNPKGLFVIAIYNKHWSSPIWRLIKWFYNVSPKFIQKFMVLIFYGIIAFAKFVFTGKNPFKKKKRGMNFYYDVIDWLGGYPYQYASKNEITNYIESKGFKLIKYVKSEVPTGCNEFVFKMK
ncbi:MAG: class I SAM-dependent methyltransferase [Candidatus Nanoarchaeia archaeon]|jgi:2-polyprenyl-6-hydroxyphenyl methylase/3-demethylubiquinone-9 3-methyltransferase